MKHFYNYKNYYKLIFQNFFQNFIQIYNLKYANFFLKFLTNLYLEGMQINYYKRDHI